MLLATIRQLINQSRHFETSDQFISYLSRQRSGRLKANCAQLVWEFQKTNKKKRSELTRHLIAVLPRQSRLIAAMRSCTALSAQPSLFTLKSDKGSERCSLSPPSPLRTSLRQVDFGAGPGWGCSASLHSLRDVPLGTPRSTGALQPPADLACKRRSAGGSSSCRRARPPAPARRLPSSQPLSGGQHRQPRVLVPEGRRRSYLQPGRR